MTILFSIDGMRPDGLAQAHTPTMDRLIANGASTMTAQTVMPCCTLPCHTCMLRGVDVPRHGITSNTFQPLVRPVPSILDLATDNGLRCGSFFNWGQLRDLCEPESIQVAFYYKGGIDPDSDFRVAEAAAHHIKRDALDFAFVYFGFTDECGHKESWMSEPYLKAISNADKCIERVLDAAGDATVLVMSDHGGHERTHGTLAPEDMTIPFILSGKGIPSGVSIEKPVIIYDAAPTLAAVMGLPRPRQWDGTSVLQYLPSTASA